jgi:phage tail P2-like protein
MSNILASAIKDTPHLAAFDVLAKHRLDNLEIDALLVYVIDTVDVSALPYLAQQFDVLGYKGMRLATTEAQQRELIKRAIELKRYSGTVWSVQEALKSIGYPDAVIQENVGTDPDHGWAEFRISIDGGANQISADKLDELVKMINVYKGTRNHLKDLSYTIDLGEDIISLTEESSESPSVDDTDTVIAGGSFLHDGLELRNGSRNYSSDTDVLEIQIINV